MKIKVEPLERGAGFKFIDKIKGGVIPKEYIPAVEKGIVEVMKTGVVSGYPVVDVSVTLYDGSFHEVDSSEIAFKVAGSQAFKEAGALQISNPIILEPVMNLEVVVPEDFMGTVIGDLNSRRGRISNTEARGKMQAIKGQSPLGEMFGYATNLRSMTEGRGAFTMEFSHYEALPESISQELKESAQAV